MARPSINRRAVEHVLDGLRRDPRGAIEGAVGQLLSIGRGPAVAAEERRTYRIDDLAQTTGVTVRNIRSYQERGLLPAPERRGRVVLFDESHVARLRIITSMLERGYTVAHITEMLGAWEAGQDLADVLGLAGVIGGQDVPAEMTRKQLRGVVGTGSRVNRLAHTGAVEVEGDRVKVVRPDLIAAFAELKDEGLSVDAMIDVHEKVAVAADAIAADLLDAGLQQLGDRFLSGEIAGEQVGELVDLLARVREVTLTSVNRTVELALEKRIADLLATYLTEYVRHADEEAG